MPALHPEIDPDGLLEYSVVFTDRSLNHMSKTFQTVMTDISSMLREVYQADATVLVPGGGTFAMEAVARQFATNKSVMIIRNGWFSYRWSQICEAGSIPASETVLMARREPENIQAPFAPMPLEEVITAILAEKPDVVFAPHVETSAGIMLPDDYIKAVGSAARDVGALFVLDCIASGAMWVDMKSCNVDVLISAPQKGWSSSPSSGVAMLGPRALDAMEASTSTSFAADLKKWHQIMQAYVNGGHAYHTTMPTDALRAFRDAMNETSQAGFDAMKQAQLELGQKVRDLMESRGFKSVAAQEFKAPTVVVSYTDDPAVQNGSKFLAQGMQIAAGVPLQCNEGEDFRTFRIGLFGLDKLNNIDRTVASLAEALDAVVEA